MERLRFSRLSGQNGRPLGIFVDEVAAERKRRSRATCGLSKASFSVRCLPFAKVGVPAISLRHGDDFVTPLTGEALNFFSNYTAKYYHQPSDQYYDWWDAASMVQNAELGLAIALKIANSPTVPRYKDTDEFSSADKKRFGK
ncbi:MAG: hypothetical protein IPG67_18045 [Acidobacteria bacterium]|nr:hypothetical protein [Acidobacteriota bacterium]